MILPSVRGSQRLQGEKLKPVVLTPRSVAAPQVLNHFLIILFKTIILFSKPLYHFTKNAQLVFPQAACPPAHLTQRLMSQGGSRDSREEERRRSNLEEVGRKKVEEQEDKRRKVAVEVESLRIRQEARRRGVDDRPLYESIYSLAGSPGGILSPPSRTTLEQLHPLQLQVVSNSEDQ